MLCCWLRLVTNTSELFCQLEVITSQWPSFTPKRMIIRRILLSDVIHLSYQIFWYFAWGGCQSCCPVDSWIIMFPFSEYYHIAAVFQSFGVPQCSEIHCDLMSLVITSIGWKQNIVVHVYSFLPILILLAPALLLLKLLKLVSPLFFWSGGRLLLWACFHPASNT